MHGGRRVRMGKMERDGEKKNERTTPQLARGDVQAAEVEMQIVERQVGLLRGGKDAQHFLADLHDLLLGEGRGQRGCHEAAFTVDRETAARKTLRMKRLLLAGERF